MKIIFLTLFFTYSVYAQETNKNVCFRFRVHLKATLPFESTIDFSKRPLPHDLEKAIRDWEDKLYFLSDKNKKENWLSCIKKFIYQDSDHDGIADWTALVDGLPSKTLFPLDQDLDGDGIENVFDPDPYHPNQATKQKNIPDHLRLTDKAGYWQKKIKNEFDLIVINHSDEHMISSLQLLYDLLSMDSLKKVSKKSFKFAYAMSGRDPEGQIAAYHPTAFAISIPGKFSYQNSLNKKQICQLASALLHETGHAFLFREVSVQKLRELAKNEGNWDLQEVVDDFWSPSLKNPFKGKNANFVSPYAESNIHEWFAENFASYHWKKNNLNNKYCPTFHDRGQSKFIGQLYK